LVWGGGWHPSAYKLGFALCYAAIPLILWACAHILTMGSAATVFAVGLGTILAWSTPSRRLLEQGDLAQVLVSQLALVHLSLFGSFGARPTTAAWAGLALSATVGWWLHPVWWAFVILFVVGCWLAALRNRHGVWPAGLWLAELSA